jgi:hypothetical protein
MFDGAGPAEILFPSTIKLQTSTTEDGSGRFAPANSWLILYRVTDEELYVCGP